MQNSNMNLLLVIFLTYCITTGNFAPTQPTESQNSMNEPQSKRIKAKSASRCDLQFSEVKIGWNYETPVSPFVELKSICPKRPGQPPHHALGNYMMIVVQSNPLTLTMVVSFETFPYNGVQPFIVIGSPDVPNVHISMATPHVQSIFSTTENSRMFPIPTGNAFAIFLLKDMTKPEAKSLNLYYNLDGKFISRVLTTDQLKFISRTTVDMLILGDTMTQDFEYMWSLKSANQAKSGSSWEEIKTADLGMSLNNCKEDYMGFDSGAFEVKMQSPGEKNSCSIPPELPENVEDDATISTTTDEVIDKRKLLHSIPDNTLQEIRTSRFNLNWIGRCESHFPTRSKLLQQEVIQKWINFPDDTNCKFTCKACQVYRSIGFRPDVKSKPNMVTTGFLAKDIYDNKDAINAHLQYPMHIEATEFFDYIKSSESDAEVYKIIADFEERERLTFNATMNVVLMAYAEIKAGLSFQTHEALMKAMRMTGANVGTIHHTADGAQSIAKVMAKSFRFKMLKHLVSSDQPFSIMVDSSTTFNEPFLAVYIQVLEDGYPVTHFFSLIYMEDGETARAMTDSFINQIKQDEQLFPGFEKYFISKLAAISSDGAAVMVGGKRSFKEFVSEYVHRAIPNVVCLSHKLDSAYKLGIKVDKRTMDGLNRNNANDNIKIWQLEYFQSFEKSSNELYSFYASRGYKKWNHLLETAEELGIVPKRMKYVYDIRWSDSHYRALETVHHNYYALVADLDQLQMDKSTDDIGRSTALQHYNRMTDKTYMAVMHEFLDILTTFKIASKKFQESSSTVVGKIEIVYDVINSLQEYKSGLGPWLQDFLKNCACFSICHEGDCSIEHYDDCTEVTINGLKLRHHFPVVLPYAFVRTKLYDNLVSAVRKYFNLEMLDAFQIFNPLRINFVANAQDNAITTVEQLYTNDPNMNVEEFGNINHRIKFICGFYNIDAPSCEQFEKEWVGLLACLVTSEGAGLQNVDESTRFWPFAMTICPDYWTEIIKKILALVMVTPFSSSEVERGFSVMNSIKTKGRTRLDKVTLDSLMAVKINGPEVTHLNPYEYTIEFLKQFARVDDATMKGGRKPAQELFPSLLKKSRIY